jgi:hypothetical protein
MHASQLVPVCLEQMTQESMACRKVFFNYLEAPWLVVALGELAAVLRLSWLSPPMKTIHLSKQPRISVSRFQAFCQPRQRALVSGGSSWMPIGCL